MPAQAATDHALEPGQAAINREREGGGGYRAGENHRGIDHRQTAEDVLAEAAGTDGGGDGCRADGNDRRHSNAGDDRRQRQRQFHLPQQLHRRHAEGRAGLDQRAIDRRQTGRRRANDWKQRIHDQHDDREAGSETADERQRQQEAEHGQAGDGLRGVGDPDNGSTCPRAARRRGCRAVRRKRSPPGWRCRPG